MLKKANITVAYDEERLSALKLFLAQKGLTVEQQIELSLDAVFHKTVPSEVRKYIEMKNDTTLDTSQQKTPRPARTESKPKQQTPVKPPVSREKSTVE